MTKVEPIRSRQSIKKIKQLLADNPRDLCLFILGINTAFRSCELVSLKVGDVYHLKAWDRLELKQTKNKKYRAVTINRTTFRAIKKWLTVHPCPSLDAPLFVSNTTKQALKSNTISKYTKHWCNQVGLQGNYSSHTLRKTWGYHIYRGVWWDILFFWRRRNRKIAELMIAFGHASEQQTLNYLCIQDKDISDLFKNQL